MAFHIKKFEKACNHSEVGLFTSRTGTTSTITNPFYWLSTMFKGLLIHPKLLILRDNHAVFQPPSGLTRLLENNMETQLSHTDLPESANISVEKDWSNPRARSP